MVPAGTFPMLIVVPLIWAVPVVLVGDAKLKYVMRSFVWIDVPVSVVLVGLKIVKYIVT